MPDDDLRTRIAAVLFRLRGFQGWDNETDECREMWRRDADAVIGELRLHRNDEEDEFGGWKPTGRHRYVTEWETTNDGN